MSAFIQFSLLTDPTREVGFWGLAVLTGCLLWRVLRQALRRPAHPDPWDSSVAATLETEEAAPLCHRCLTPHDSLAHFCSNCGAPVGTCTNLLPFPYLFSIGHLLRIGTDGSYRRTPLAIAGFFLVGVAEYSFLAPVYWFMFLRGLVGRPSSGSPPGETIRGAAPSPQGLE